VRLEHVGGLSQWLAVEPDLGERRQTVHPQNEAFTRRRGLHFEAPPKPPFLGIKSTGGSIE
jgi:hypothetical protein